LLPRICSLDEESAASQTQEPIRQSWDSIVLELLDCPPKIRSGGREYIHHRHMGQRVCLQYLLGFGTGNRSHLD
jgi:hypothetical protein